MIGRLRGIVLEKQPPEIVLDVNGVGYEIYMPMTCFYELPDSGTEIVLFTHFVVREDAQLLYGFTNKQARALFRELIKVNGVGPKLALAILSGMSAPQFIHAVEQQEVNHLTKLPGVGKKTAERLIVEMKDRFKRMQGDLLNQGNELIIAADGATKHKDNDAETEAIAALIALGYKPQDASRMISKVIKDGDNSEDLIRNALRAAL